MVNEPEIVRSACGLKPVVEVHDSAESLTAVKQGCSGTRGDDGHAGLIKKCEQVVKMDFAEP